MSSIHPPPPPLPRPDSCLGLMATGEAIPGLRVGVRSATTPRAQMRQSINDLGAVIRSSISGRNTCAVALYRISLWVALLGFAVAYLLDTYEDEGTGRQAAWLSACDLIRALLIDRSVDMSLSMTQEQEGSSQTASNLRPRLSTLVQPCPYQRYASTPTLSGGCVWVGARFASLMQLDLPWGSIKKALCNIKPRRSIKGFLHASSSCPWRLIFFKAEGMNKTPQGRDATTTPSHKKDWCKH